MKRAGKAGKAGKGAKGGKGRERAGAVLRVGLAFVAGACAGAEGSGGEAAVRDSAGIQIVENGAPIWGEGEGWTLSAEPVLSIGGRADDPLYDLGQVSYAARLTDGRIVIANGVTFEVRFYDADGTHLQSMGRQGSGPGEFQSLAIAQRVTGDSVYVGDMMSRRITVVAPDGTVPRTFALGGETGLPMPTGGRMTMAIPAAVYRDGSVLGMVMGFRMPTPGGDAAPDGAYRDSSHFVHYSRDGVAEDTLVTLPGIEMETRVLQLQNQSFPAPMPVPLGRTTVVAAGDGTMYSSTNDVWEIEMRDPAGTVTRIIRMTGTPMTITEQDKAAHREETLEQLDNQPGMSMVPEPLKEQMRQGVREADYPATMPFIVDLNLDAEGNLWVNEVVRPGTKTRSYAVFNPDGVLLGRVTTPPRFRPTQFGSAELVGVWQDEDDVEYVRVYALSK